MDEEIDYEWEREGDPVKDVIAEAAEGSEEVAEDIRRPRTLRMVRKL
jgi:hypothetical protein